MKLTYLTAAFAALGLLWGCSAKAPAPDISVNVFRDRVYPCVRVAFPETIDYKGRQDLKTDNDTYTIYTLGMNTKPYYTIQVVKRFSANFGWTLEPISEQYDDAMKLYEISGSDDLLDRSAAVVLIERDGQIYLRGIVGEYTRPDTVYYVTLDRLVQKRGYLHLFSIDSWKNSAAGKRIVNDMVQQVDWIFGNADVIDCSFGERVDKF